MRAREEYRVSHLPGAVHAETAGQVLALLAGEPEDRPVIIYCSVGVRSAQLASAVLGRTSRSVRNLEGSIFAWANRGWALERDGGTASTVHPYDRRWGSLLDRSRWSFEP